jgi:hypothetical protein
LTESRRCRRPGGTGGKGDGGAQSRSRRDEDGGGREKGRSGDGSAFNDTAGEGIGKGGDRAWEAATRRGGAGDDVGDRCRGWVTRGGRHRPEASTRGRQCAVVRDRGAQALMSGPRL